jgi:hypothetical protein
MINLRPKTQVPILLTLFSLLGFAVSLYRDVARDSSVSLNKRSTFIGGYALLAPCYPEGSFACGTAFTQSCCPTGTICGTFGNVCCPTCTFHSSHHNLTLSPQPRIALKQCITQRAAPTLHGFCSHSLFPGTEFVVCQDGMACSPQPVSARAFVCHQMIIRRISVRLPQLFLVPQLAFRRPRLPKAVVFSKQAFFKLRLQNCHTNQPHLPNYQGDQLRIHSSCKNQLRSQ